MGTGVFASKVEISPAYTHPVDWNVTWGDESVRVRERLAYDARLKGSKILNERINRGKEGTEYVPVCDQDCTCEIAFKSAGFQGIDYIVDRVCEYYKLDPDILYEKRNRFKTTTRALSVICYIARERTDASWPEIGQALLRSHATCQKKYKSFKEKMTDGHHTNHVAQVREILSVFP